MSALAIRSASRSRLRSMSALFALGLAAVLVTGCIGEAQRQSPPAVAPSLVVSASASAMPSPSASASAFAARSAATSESASAAPSAANPTAIPSASATADQGPRVEWVRGALLNSYQSYTGDGSTLGDTFDDAVADIAGWSGGYLAFTGPIDVQGRTSIRTAYSVDGIKWAAGEDIPTTADWTSTSVVEGPAGLLAVGWAGACGSPETLQAMWPSADGIHWGANLGSVFTGATVLSLSGGSVGYIATGYVGDIGHSSPVVWISKDAKNWTKSNLTGSAFTNSSVSGAAAFAGGYVLVGASWPSHLPDCPSPEATSVWWSADGRLWTKPQLPGGFKAADVSSAVYRLSDREVLVQATDGQKSASWISTDGKTWTAVDLPVDSWGGRGDRGLILMYRNEVAADGTESTYVSASYSVRAGGVAKLASAGDPPENVWGEAMGPAGLLVIGLEFQSWLGTPVDPGN